MKKKIEGRLLYKGLCPPSGCFLHGKGTITNRVFSWHFRAVPFPPGSAGTFVERNGAGCDINIFIYCFWFFLTVNRLWGDAIELVGSTSPRKYGYYWQPQVPLVELWSWVTTVFFLLPSFIQKRSHIPDLGRCESVRHEAKSKGWQGNPSPTAPAPAFCHKIATELSAVHRQESASRCGIRQLFEWQLRISITVCSIESSLQSSKSVLALTVTIFLNVHVGRLVILDQLNQLCKVLLLQ